MSRTPIAFAVSPSTPIGEDSREAEHALDTSDREQDHCPPPSASNISEEQDDRDKNDHGTKDYPHRVGV